MHTRLPLARDLHSCGGHFSVWLHIYDADIVSRGYPFIIRGQNDAPCQYSFNTRSFYIPWIRMYAALICWVFYMVILIQHAVWAISILIFFDTNVLHNSVGNKLTLKIYILHSHISVGPASWLKTRMLGQEGQECTIYYLENHNRMFAYGYLHVRIYLLKKKLI